MDTILKTYKANNQEQNLINKILDLKTKKKAVILAHYYQRPQIYAVADYLGDSLELSRISKTVEKPIIVFCGVKFMAQTAKILSPESKVLLPAIDAGCPLADTIEVEQLKALKDKHPDAWVVSYVNTTAEIKAITDVCCTSANAVKVVKNIPAKKVIFTPDKNLGWWVKKNVPEKEIILWQGFCYVHEQFSLEDLNLAKKNYPQAKIMVHPECQKEILERADYVTSTAGMLNIVAKSGHPAFVIGTEVGIIEALKNRYPDREFYSLGKVRTCVNMKKTTLEKVYQSLEREEFVIEVEKEIANKAALALERMVKYI